VNGAQTPLVDLLRSVPEDARLIYTHGPYEHQHIPVGKLCRSAADKLESYEQSEPVASLMTHLQSGDVELVWNDDGFDRAMWAETPLCKCPVRQKPSRTDAAGADYDKELHAAWVRQALHLALEYRDAESGREVRDAMRAMKAHFEGRPASMWDKL
jgi:hypothetical protein